MPAPQAMCLEDLAPSDELSRYTQCVAVAGGEPGLGLDRRGGVLWRKGRVTGCELWVSLDERLMLLRPEGAAPVTVRRGERSLDVPFERPVVLLDQDEVEVGGKRLRLHLHGEVDDVFAPAPYPLRDTGVGRAVRAAAAALAIGVAAGNPACNGSSPGQAPSGQTQEPGPAAAEPDKPTGPPPAAADTGPATAPPRDAGPAGDAAIDAGAAGKPAGDKPKTPKIDVRTKPPKVVRPKVDEKIKQLAGKGDPLGGLEL